MGEAASPALALRDLRRARHHRHQADVDWVETLYRVYVTVLSGAAVIWLSASKVSDASAKKGGVADIRDHGAAVLGLVVAFLVALGLRSGSRGGPLSLEAADVRVVLLAPIRRRLALRAPALHQVRSAAFVGLCLGAVVGNLAGHRLPGHFAGWVAADAGFGLVAAVLAVGMALLACGLRLPRPAAGAVGLAVLAWSAADVAAGTVTSPLTIAGRLGLGPLPGDVRGGPLGLAAAVGAVAAVGVLALAIARLGHMSLEAADHRGRLAAQLRFALSLQDLRAVILLRRRLAAEEPRARPWIALRRGGGRRFGRLSGSETGVAVRRRGLHSLMRWPLTRVLRVGGLGIAAGLAAAGAWKGTTPLVVVAGVALFVAALDALEPLAQEFDHPTRLDSFPVPPAQLADAALLVPAAVLAATALIGVAIALAVTGVAAGPLLISVVPAAAAAVAGGAASLVLEPVSAAELMSRYPVPEAAGPVLVARLGFAPALAVAGWLPLLAGRAAVHQKVSPEAAVFQSGIAVAGLSIFVVRILANHFQRKRAVPEP
ncbi:MAG TPA: hypothetical protein VKX24_01920 [Acidimicrobiia bacterium]|nr:hypothetical protein [Acidimicrobiia bacterium]HZQ76512.1 hypothetical protein [Acidimicrobiia bacterium]